MLATLGAGGGVREIEYLKPSRNWKNAMAFIPVPGGIQAELRYNLLGQRTENVLWFRTPSLAVPTVADLTDVAEMLSTWWNASVKPLQGANTTLREIYLTGQNAADGASYTYTTGLPVDGTLSGEALPNNCALVVSLRTEKRGRSYRGRVYHMGITEGVCNGNQVTDTYANNVVSAYDALISDAATAGFNLVVCSRRSGNAPRASGVLTTVIDALLVDTVIDSQRRRLPGRGS